MNPNRSWNKNGPTSPHFKELPCTGDWVTSLVDLLGGLQVFCSVAVIALHLVVVVKPLYDKTVREASASSVPGRDNELSRFGRFHCVFRSLCEGAPPALYYFGYALMCMLAQSTYPPLCAFLLLDIVVKSSTTRDVLMAVYIPRRELFFTVLVLLFSVYIFSTM